VSCRTTSKEEFDKTTSDFWFADSNSFVEFDSYIIPTRELSDRGLRLLDTDNHTIVPFNTHIRMLISSADVLHAWTVPSPGVKAVAVPGRITQVKFICQRALISFFFQPRIDF
jgi:cytochrome c oxidase subunit 2